VNKVYGK